MSKPELWTAEMVRDVLTNPVYTGVGPFPRIVEDEAWISCAVKQIEEHGAEAFIRAMLGNLHRYVPGPEPKP